jgi:hypothetical protein
VSRVGPAALRGRVYEPSLTLSEELELALVERGLPGLEVKAGQLIGPNVSVESRCVLVDRNGTGELVGVAMEPITLVGGGLCFDPRAGGIRTRHNRLAEGEFNADVAEAARFGMVNTFFHLDRAARYVNRLLQKLHAAELPPVHAVVSAHAGSRLSGYASMDGDFRRNRLYPFQGGHYRVSQLTTGVPEPLPVRPTGEIHLGPGIRRAPFAGELRYLRNASHNPATIYHEYGHHLCRHTADFRLNSERSPELQRNGKTGPEEGVCDYLVAALLGTSRPYGWYQPRRGAWRDPDKAVAPQEGETDPHVLGAWWASAWWRCRSLLLEEALIRSAEDHDRVLIRALLELGRVAARPGDRRRRGERTTERNSDAAVSTAYLSAVGEKVGPRAADRAVEVLQLYGLLGRDRAVEERC